MKMAKRARTFLILFLAAGLSLWGADSVLVKKTLKYGHNTKQDQPTGKAAIKFADLVKQKTNGEVEIQVFPANQLGNNRQMIENVKMGAQDLCTEGLGILGVISPLYNMMQVPYVFRSQEHIRTVVAGDIGKELSEDLEKKTGIFLLTQDWDRMVRHIGGRKPIRTLEDFKGYKVRAGVLPPIATFKAMGASPVKIPLNEMYVALQQGVADGAELPVDYFYNYSIFEVAKYLNLTYHTYGTQFVAVNKRVWDSLGSANQIAMMEAAAEAGAYNNQLVSDLAGDYLAKLKAGGMEMIDTDVAEFQAALKEHIGEIAKNWPGSEALYQKIQAVK
jgi:tripartite ATP-independent transporter DctP family solute receptor